MALMKLDAAKFEESAGALKKSVNEEVLESMQGVANALNSTGDDNRVVTDTVDACKKYQAQYNVTIEAVGTYLDELGKVYDISEFMAKKANVGDVSSRDTGFTTDKVDTSKFRI